MALDIPKGGINPNIGSTQGAGAGAGVNPALAEHLIKKMDFVGKVRAAQQVLDDKLEVNANVQSYNDKDVSVGMQQARVGDAKPVYTDNSGKIVPGAGQLVNRVIN